MWREKRNLLRSAIELTSPKWITIWYTTEVTVFINTVTRQQFNYKETLSTSIASKKWELNQNFGEQEVKQKLTLKHKIIPT